MENQKRTNKSGLQSKQRTAAPHQTLTPGLNTKILILEADRFI